MGEGTRDQRQRQGIQYREKEKTNAAAMDLGSGGPQFGDLTTG